MTRAHAIVGAVLALSLGASPARSAPPAQRFDPDAANLYLVRKLDNIYKTWPAPSESVADAHAMGERLAEISKELEVFRVVAKGHNLDPLVVDAYDQTIKLQEAYDRFLIDAIYADLTADVARPDVLTHKLICARSYRNGKMAAKAGMKLGGPKASLALGALVSGYTMLRLMDEREDAINKNERISVSRKKAAVEHIAVLRRHWKTRTESLNTHAQIMAGKEKYGWGAEVGFDNSDEMSYAELIVRRPRDPFLPAAEAVRQADRDPVRAARLFAKAAALVPADFDEGVDFFDQERAEYYLTAARLLDEPSRAGGMANEDLASEVVRYYRAARDCLKDGDKQFAQEARLAYARACASAGLRYDASGSVIRLLTDYPNDADLLYEGAGIWGQLGNVDTALDCLRRSFDASPRWQPGAKTDSRLARLRALRPTDVLNICANPALGTWKGANGLEMHFRYDGTYYVRAGVESRSGTFELLPGDKIRMARAGNQITYPCSFPGDQFNLGDTKLTRQPGPIFGVWAYPGQTLEVRPDGTWTKDRAGDDGKSVVTSGTLTLGMGQGASPDQFRLILSRSTALLGRVEQKFLLRIDGNTMRVQIEGDDHVYVYRRR